MGVGVSGRGGGGCRINLDIGLQGTNKRVNSFGDNPEFSEIRLFIANWMFPKCTSQFRWLWAELRRRRHNCLVCLILFSLSSDRGDMIGEKLCCMRKAVTQELMTELVKELPGSVISLEIGKLLI